MTQNIQACERMARDLMKAHGLDGWSFQWSNAKRCAGVCRYKSRVIRLSRPIAELWGADRMRDTVLHEIAHALAGYGAAHGPEWQAVCVRIGARPERCYAVDESTPLPPSKYTGTCPNGHVHRRERMPANPKPQSCGKCSRRYDTRYLITWAETPTANPEATSLLAAMEDLAKSLRA